MKYLAGMVLACSLFGCAASPKDRLDFTLVNGTDRPILIRMEAGIFVRTVRVESKQCWKGWIDKRFAVSRSEIFFFDAASQEEGPR